MAPGTTFITKLKVQLKLAIARLRMVQQRDEQVGKAQRRAMAQLLEQGKVESAKIRVENIIRSDITSELHEMLELYCELLLARAGLFEAATVDPGLDEAVQSIVYAAPKTEIKELVTVRNLFAEKFGKDYVRTATDNADAKVNDKVVRKLSVVPPRQELVQGYLEEIAKAYGVAWPHRQQDDPASSPTLLDEDPDADADADAGDRDGHDDQPSSGGSKAGAEQPLAAQAASTPIKKLPPRQDDLSRATPPPSLRSLGGPKSPVTVTPPRMTTDNVHPKVTLNSVELKPNKRMEDAAKAKDGKEPEGGVPDITDLERRFAALKKV